MPRWAQWAVVLASLTYALLSVRFEWGGIAAYLLGLLPALVTLVVSGSVTGAIVVFLIPIYFVINQLTASRQHYQPSIWLDDAMAVWPEWIFVYASLYLCAFLLPIVVVRGRWLIEHTLRAYLFVMLVSYVIFWIYPTVAPRVEGQSVTGPAERALQLFYDLDQPYGCFPSLHVAYSVVGAFACHHMNRALGRAMLAWSVLIAISTVYTKQHFVLDAAAGGLLGLAARAMFLRTSDRRYDCVCVQRRSRSWLFLVY